MLNSQPRHSVSSLFANIERALAQDYPTSSQALLGVRWSFGLPHDSEYAFREYSFPLGEPSYVALLSERTGVQIESYAGVDDQLPGYLDSGLAAVVAVDSYHLPYRPAYRRVHSSRTVLVRIGSDSRSFTIEDLWPPTYSGTISRHDITRARWSRFDEDRRLEPIFSGDNIDGRWFGVAARTEPIRDAVGWVMAILRRMVDEATTSTRDEIGEYGLGAMDALQFRLRDSLSDPHEAFPVCRTTSLLLRAELSCRVYMVAFLRTAARILGDRSLAAAVQRYEGQLHHMQHCRDLLCKFLAHSKHAYIDCIFSSLRGAISGEHALLSAVSHCIATNEEVCDRGQNTKEERSSERPVLDKKAPPRRLA